MRLSRVIFRESCEGPGVLTRVAYLQSTEPARRDSYVADLALTPLGVSAGAELYPLSMIRRVTIESAPALGSEALAQAPRGRGRPRLDR